MTIQLNPETEKLVREELESGRFHSIDDIILQGIRARRETGQRRNDAQRCDAVDRALEFAKQRAVPLEGLSIKELIHEGHRM